MKEFCYCRFYAKTQNRSFKAMEAYHFFIQRQFITLFTIKNFQYLHRRQYLYWPQMSNWRKCLKFKFEVDTQQKHIFFKTSLGTKLRIFETHPRILTKRILISSLIWSSCHVFTWGFKDLFNGVRMIQHHPGVEGTKPKDVHPGIFGRPFQKLVYDRLPSYLIWEL